MKITGLNVIIIALLSQFFLSKELKAQDIHFSQFYTTSVLNNPAQTGISENDLRIACNYRNQWASIGQALNTYYFSVDKKQMIVNEQFGFGFSVVNDNSFGGILKVNKLFFSVSYTKFINNHQIVIGIQPGYVGKLLGSNSLTYGTQFNPITNKFDPSLPSRETGVNDNTNYFDLNAGVYWRTYIRNIMPSAGFSVGHLNRPTENFTTSRLQSTLPLKYIITAQAVIPIWKSYDLTPCILTTYTPGAREFVSGAIGGYNLENRLFSIKRLYVTNLYRVNPVRNIDAVIVGGGINFASFDLGITYDLNVSSLRKATHFRGGFEISLQYTGGGNKPKIVEPCHIY